MCEYTNPGDTPQSEYDKLGVRKLRKVNAGLVEALRAAVAAEKIDGSPWPGEQIAAALTAAGATP